MNVICFHNPDEENGYLSNWYLSHFTVNGIDFSSMEQFMMYQKAYRFHDEEIANNILHTDNVAEIKKLGRKVHAYDENVWNCIHGRELGEADRDEERKQTMRVLARNMTFLMKSIELGKKQFGLPEKEEHAFTHFIR